MARLNYRILFENQNALTRRLYIDLHNFTEVPQARIYKVGDTPPAFANMTLIPSFTNYYFMQIGPSFTDGAFYQFEYKTSEGEFQLGKIKVVLNPATGSCYTEKTQITYQVDITDVGVTMLFFTDGSTVPNQVSLDGITYKSISAFGNAYFTNSEMAAMGIVGTIDNIYFKRISNACIDNLFSDVLIGFEVPEDLVATISGTNETSAELNDGTITVTVTGGEGNYLVTWWDATTTTLTGTNPLSSTRTGVSAGFYNITVKDIVTDQEVNLSILITEPEVIPPPSSGTILQIPMLNSIQFVVPETIDGCAVFQTLDNTLFKDQYFPGFAKANYYQPFCKCDAPIIQFNSDFSINTVQLFKCEDNTLVKALTVELKEQNIGVVEDFNISIKTHPGFSTQSRVYFSGGVIPIPLSTGESLQVLNNSDGFDGVYTIIDILTDTITGSQYLVINLTYDASGPSSPATGRFDVSTDDFNVFEAVCSLVDVDNGIYYIKITSYDVTEGDGLYAISEPMDVQVDHPSTNLLEYSNVDNAFDMTWTTGYIGRIRVPSILAKRLPGGETTTSRDADYSLVTTSGKFIRGVLFETFLLPPYMHEKLSVIFKLDYKAINKVQYNTLEGYGEPQYINQVLLSNSSIKLEQVKVFRKYNSDDIGSVSDGGFILSDSGFIRR